MNRPCPCPRVTTAVVVWGGVGPAFLLAVGLGACTPKVVTPTGSDAGAPAGLDAMAMDKYVAPDLFIGGDAAPSGPDATCATQSAGAEPIPLDLYVMMDSSKSMLDTTGAGMSKWQAVSGAMTAFFNDPQSGGLGIGLKYFPDVEATTPATCTVDGPCGTFGPCDRRKTCVRTGTTTSVVTPFCLEASTCAANEACALIGTCATGEYCAPAGTNCASGGACTALDGYCHGRDICEVAPYAAPAVATAALPGAAAALVASLSTHAPGGFTPTGPALTGAIQYARLRATATPDHKVAVVLVTDGLPGGFIPGFPRAECAPSDIGGVVTLARGGASGTPAIPTFVIGVFGPTEATTAGPNLDMLAQAGGTMAAVVISTNQDVTRELQTALNQIRTKALACEYKVPPPTTGAIDFGKVNVQFTSGAGAGTTIGHTSSKATCDPVRGGWYYDVDPSTGGRPTTIRACDATCATFQTDMAGRVDIVLGCVTISIG